MNNVNTTLNQYCSTKQCQQCRLYRLNIDHWTYLRFKEDVALNISHSTVFSVNPSRIN